MRLPNLLNVKTSSTKNLSGSSGKIRTLGGLSNKVKPLGAC